MQLVIN